MIYCNECFDCPLREKIVDPNNEKAKNFYARTGTPYTFQCGAEYYRYHDIKPPLSAPAFCSEQVEVAPVKKCLKLQYLNFLQMKEEKNQQTEWSIENIEERLKVLNQEEAKKKKRIKSKRSHLTCEDVVLKWISYFVSQCEWMLHAYYTEKISFLWDDFFNERRRIQEFLLDMMSEDVKNIRDIIVVVYGENSDEVFNYDLLLRTYQLNLNEKVEIPKE